jgi:hypothetical protein
MTEQENKNDEQQELGFYEKMSKRTVEILEEGKKTFDEALKKASEEMSGAGEFSSEQADKVKSWVRRDFALMGEHAEKARDSFKKAVEPHRVAAGAQSLFSWLLNSTAETLSGWAEKTEKQLEYKTGEVTSPGTLTCKACEAEMHLKSNVRIPPCPKCYKTLFRKSY